MVLERSDGRGNFIREVIPNSQGGMIGQRASNNPFANFLAILELMAERQGNVDHGLTKDEIKQLKRVRYEGDNEKK